MKKFHAKLSLFVLVGLAVLAPSVVRADYPPVPKELGRRVDTPVPAPTVCAKSAAVAVKPEAIAVVIEPKSAVRMVKTLAKNEATGRITTLIVYVPTGAETITPQLKLPAGSYRVQVDCKLKNGSEVRWNAGIHTVKKKK